MKNENPPNIVITLTRDTYGKNETLGTISLGGHILHTLEPVMRQTDADVSEWKLKGVTAIPTGRYQLNFGPSFRFKKNLLRLKDVPGFTGILIHPGNKWQDTQGCILVGMRRNKNHHVHESVKAVRYIEQVVNTWLWMGSKVSLEVVNGL